MQFLENIPFSQFIKSYHFILQQWRIWKSKMYGLLPGSRMAKLTRGETFILNLPVLPSILLLTSLNDTIEDSI